MNLQDDLIKSFTQAINQSGGEKSGEKTVYAEVARIEDGVVKIKIDGSDLETPATSMVEVGVGDRVFATIKGHSVVITGNISFPSLTRVGDVYITLTANGLVVGKLDQNNNPVGSYVLLSDDSLTIYDDNHQVLSSFGINQIELGYNTSALITMCGGKAVIGLDSGTLRIRGGNNVEAIGISNSYGNAKSEVVCEAKNSTPRLSLQLMNGASTLASIYLAANDHVKVTTPSNKYMTVNGYEVLTTHSNVIAVGSVTAPSKMIAKDSITTLTITVSPPTGYKLVGVCGISSSSYSGLNYIGSVNVNASNNTITMLINTYNAGAAYVNLDYVIRWFAIKANAIAAGGDTSITW